MSRFFGVVLALLVLSAPVMAEAASGGRPAQRRVSTPASRCGRHVVEVVGGAVRMDGKAVDLNGHDVALVIAPSWRRGCTSVAWVEQRGTERRLVVVPSVGPGAQALSWALPPTDGDERIFWIGRSRITVGAHVLKPRATASWS